MIDVMNELNLPVKRLFPKTSDESPNQPKKQKKLLKNVNWPKILGPVTMFQEPS